MVNQSFWGFRDSPSRWITGKPLIRSGFEVVEERTFSGPGFASHGERCERDTSREEDENRAGFHGKDCRETALGRHRFLGVREEGS
jgi:hypothetical protein